MNQDVSGDATDAKLYLLQAKIKVMENTMLNVWGNFHQGAQTDVFSISM